MHCSKSRRPAGPLGFPVPAASPLPGVRPVETASPSALWGESPPLTHRRSPACSARRTRRGSAPSVPRGPSTAAGPRPRRGSPAWAWPRALYGAAWRARPSLVTSQSRANPSAGRGRGSYAVRPVIGQERELGGAHAPGGGTPWRGKRGRGEAAAWCGIGRGCAGGGPCVRRAAR